MSDSNLLCQGSLGIPVALASTHDMLCAELAQASLAPGRLGIAAKRVNELCMPHFAKEEEDIFRVFGILHDLASERVQPAAALPLPLLSELRARRDTSRESHAAIHSAVDDLLKRALAERNESIAKLADALKNHEREEDEVMYPTIISIGQSLRQGLRT